MLFSWWKNRRRRRILADAFPSAWLEILLTSVGHYHVLAEPDRARLRDTIQILIAEKDWEGCRGLEMTDTVRVTVAALACVMILRLNDFYFENVQTILVYPSEYIVKQEHAIAGDLTLHEESERLGEAHRNGPIILSWDEVQANGREPGFGENLVFHEFAHKLDMRNGEMDGTPDMPTRDLAARWSRIMDDEFRQLQRAERKGRDTLIDKYGASDPAEFFAVVSECYFDAPQAMRAEHPVLYDLFCENTIGKTPRPGLRFPILQPDEARDRNYFDIISRSSLTMHLYNWYYRQSCYAHTSHRQRGAASCSAALASR